MKPWTSDADREGWHTVARGAGVPRRISISLKVDLDADQTEWIERESERTGQDSCTIIKNLIERERAARP